MSLFLKTQCMWRRCVCYIFQKQVFSARNFPFVSIFGLTFTRNVRKGAQPYKLLKGGVVQIDNDSHDFKDVKDWSEINKTLKKIVSDPEEVQSEAEMLMEEDHNITFENTDKMHDIHMWEEKKYKSFIKKKIIKRKYFKTPKETNLLTYAAKKQIRYLHSLNPQEWTPEKLSSSFPISVNGVKKLLKNNSELHSKEKIEQHDAEVAEKWKQLKYNNFSSISPITIKLWKEGKLLQDYYAGNPSLPTVVEPTYETKKAKLNQKGEHLAIIEKYLALKHQKSVTQTENIKTIDKRLVMDDIKLSSKSRNCTEKDLLSFKINDKKNEVYEEQRTKVSCNARSNEFDPDISQAEFKQNLCEELSQKCKTTADKDFLNWLKKEKGETEKCVENSSAICFTQTRNKYQNNVIEITKVRSNSNKNCLYMYNEKTGYSYPFGKDVKQHIKIPSHLYKKNAVYKFENCIYDEYGNFLYKI